MCLPSKGILSIIQELFSAIVLFAPPILFRNNIFKKKDLPYQKDLSNLVCIFFLLTVQMVQVGEVEAGGDVAREQWDVTVAHVDMGPDFWRKHPNVFNR